MGTNHTKETETQIQTRLCKERNTAKDHSVSEWIGKGKEKNTHRESCEGVTIVGIGFDTKTQSYEHGRLNPERTMTAEDGSKELKSDNSWNVE